ncbi:class I SAM-dependent methyltransferase [Streptomyces inhibens]|uniref:Class I SAM-dependent methyltransferase n=2 Tax=Streptomyces inhibens TaxID=2293571 RepID=A0A371PYM2_STRIH|nr:class I SAM-dependent methyltransferase [Streptomyces inhibens]
MNPEFSSRVAYKFGGYSSGAQRTEVFPDGDPEDAFDDLAIGLGRPGARLVDVGCADGRNVLRVAPAFTSVLGIDLSMAMLESAGRHRETRGLDHVEFELRDASGTGLPDGDVDVVTSRRGPLFPDEFRRILKPGGSLIYLGIGEQDVRELKETFGRGRLHGRWNGRPVARETAEQLTDAGFTVVAEKAFFYEEFFHSPTDLDTFLQQVPIFEDYDPVADRGPFDRYVASAAGSCGVRLARHWFLLHARKAA